MLDETSVELVMPRGADGTIFRNKDGECIKRLSHWSSGAVRSVLSVYNALLAAHIPTFDKYEPDFDKHEIRMNDVSNGGKNLVVSATDFLKFARQPDGSTEENVDIDSIAHLWTTSTRNKPVQNPDVFVDEFRKLVDLTIQNNFRFVFSVYFLIATPNGTLSTIVGDIEDAAMGNQYPGSRQRLEHDEISAQVDNAAHYLANVALPFFPALQSHILDTFTYFERKYHISLYPYREAVLNKKINFHALP